MRIRRQIFIPMITLTIVCCIAVLVVSIILYNRELDNSVMGFVTVGILVTLIVLVICLFIARFISMKIERRLEAMMDDSKKVAMSALTERKSSEERMIKLLETMDTMLIVTEVETDKILFVNESFIKSLDLPDDIVGKVCWKVLTVGATGRCAHCPKFTLDTGSEETVSWTLKSPLNNKHHRIISRYIDWPDGTKVFLEQCDDITELVESQDRLRAARDEAEAASEAKSIFLANMSHEIRTPMNSIIGFSELALDGDITKETYDYLNNIQNSAEWLLDIINNILDISKIESGKIALENSPFNLHDVFKYCQLAITPSINQKEIKLYCYTEPSVGKKLVGDPIRLRQIIMNLLTNAVKFTHVGTIKLFAKIVSADEDRIKIHFDIRDSGIGISTENIKRIFEPFVQADNSITRKFGGTGLGLTITKSIIELMGGTLNVESTVGIGSRFSFDIEFDLIDDIETAGDKIGELKSGEIGVNVYRRPTFNGEVLVCEDNPLNQQVISEHLEKVGLKSVLANNGKEGYDIIKARHAENRPFDLVFMDIHMPVMDGLEASAKINSLGVTTPIIAVTANIMTMDLELYKASGMCDTLGKPFKAHELWKCLTKYLTAESYSIIEKVRYTEEESGLKKKLKLRFHKNNEDIVAKIKDALSKDDITLAHRLAHTLKSNAGQIDERTLFEAAESVEIMLRDGKTKLKEEHLDALETEVNNTLERIAPPPDEKNKKAVMVSVEYDTKKAHLLFDKLMPLLVVGRVDSIKFTDELSLIPGTAEIIDHIENYDFKKAKEALDGFIKEMPPVS